MNKLYPPGGAAPDSKTFDITLLFVLLRNICDLTAPATGWDALPPAADVSREANLARIKYYRNQVYGHVTSTGVSKADFERYWNDISGALIALGADQVEIDLLKSSAIGETDHIALLKEWKSQEDDVKEMFCELNEKVQKLDAKVDALKPNPLLEQLSKCEFAQHIRSLVEEEFQEGTREWILEMIEAFCTNQNVRSRAIVITALPGVGKSVLAAVACRNAEKKSRLGACRFIQHNNSQRNNPRIVIESIARHFCDRIEGFKDKLYCKMSSLQPDMKTELERMNMETLFCFLLEEPLNAMPCLSTEQAFVVVINALDEIDPNSRKDFIRVFLKRVHTFPKCIKFVLTSRPIKQLLAELPQVTVFNVEATGSNNTDDIILYLRKELESLYQDEPFEKRETTTLKLTERSQGIFLYAHFAIESANKRNLSLSESSELFPKGMSSVYEDYLSRSQTELKLHKVKFMNFLEGIRAAQAPLPKSVVLQILGITEESREQRMVGRKALNSLSLLFPEEGKCISIFHNSLANWLAIAEREDDDNDFCVKVADGHRLLAEHCLKVLRKVKNHDSFPPELNDSENYALTFGFHHMLEAGGYEEHLGECVQDLELLAAVWVAREKTISKIPLQRKADMVEELKRISNCSSLPDEDLSHLCTVMTAVHVQTDCPQFVLQCAAYCTSSTGLSLRATQLLRSPKYRNWIWVERQEMYLFEEHHRVVSCLPSNHTITCLCVHSRNQSTNPIQSSGYTLITFNTEDGRLLAKVDLGTLDYEPHTQVSPNDSYVVVYEMHGRQLQLRDVKELEIRRTFEVEHFNQLLSCCFVRGNKLAALCGDRTVRVWDVESGVLETTLRCPGSHPENCLPSPAGQLITVAKDVSGSYSVLLWKSLTPPQTVDLHSDNSVRAKLSTKEVSFTKDGQLASFVCKDKQSNERSYVVRLCDVTTAQLRNYFCITMNCPSHIFIDDSYLLLNGSPQVKVVNINDGSSQELAAEQSFVWYKSNRECVALHYRDLRRLHKLTFHNLK